MKNYLETILNFLRGKKGTLGLIYGAVFTYLRTKNYIGDAEVVLAFTVGGAIFPTLSYATSKIIYKK